MTALYLLRHADATWPDWNRPDDERPLTKKGKKQMRRVAQALAKRGVRPAILFSSPLPRAHETAVIASGELGLDVNVEPTLAPGFDAEALRRLLETHAGQDLMLVGHEPDFSNLIEALTGGVVVMPKAGIACIDLTGTSPPAGELRWLVSPKFLH